jgi:Kef-type K+ transport system membrane component KefB
MTAAGFPWLFVAAWFLLLIEGLEVDQAFIVARFAAPTSAGILFSMLEGAGLRDTWVFGKARILAIFDDLDTILLMIPLKILMVGFKWELMVVVSIMVLLLALAWRYLHRLSLPHSSAWSLLYGAVVTAFCYGLYKVTKHSLPMQPMHIEVLLPAFVLGCMIDTPCARHELEMQRKAALAQRANVQIKELRQAKEGEQKQEEKPPTSSTDSTGFSDNARQVEISKVVLPGCFEDDADGNSTPSPDAARAFDDNKSEAAKSQFSEAAKSQLSRLSRLSRTSRTSRLSRHGHDKDESHPEESEFEQNVQTAISMVFMVLVGLSMPPLVGRNAKGDSTMDAGLVATHVVAVSALMIVGKMFPVLCYRDEASFKERLALCMGMCPRGEVGASIIVISLELGVSGPAVIISMCALVINLVLSGGFIGAVKLLLKAVPHDTPCQLVDLHKVVVDAGTHAKPSLSTFSV